MFTNKRQIELPLESWGIKNPTSNPLVAPISVLFQEVGLLINEDGNLQKFENQRINKMKEYYGYIYLILDQKNNKVYVGQKKGKIEDSKNYFGSGTIIQNIIKKRGTYFLKKIILGVCDNLEELLDCEEECKHFFNTFDRKYGYNIAIRDLGGDNFTFNPNKEEVRNKISIRAKEHYKQHPERAKNHSLIISGNKNGRYKKGYLTAKELNGKYIKIDESKLIKLYNLGFNCYEIGEIFNTSAIVPKSRLRNLNIIKKIGRHSSKRDKQQREFLIIQFKKGEINYEQLIKQRENQLNS